jgi:poly-gamma-glutamate synthase PgsB/CapB
MRQLKKEIIQLFETDLSTLDNKLFKENIGELTEALLKRHGLRNRPEHTTEKAWLSYQIIDFLVDTFKGELDLIQSLHGLQADFNQRFASSNTENEKRELIIQFALELGASSAGIRGDRRAFKRWFGYDVVVERCRRRISHTEYCLVFLLNRFGVVTSTLLGNAGDETEQARLLHHVNIEKTLKPLLVYNGDERVKIETFRCMSQIIKRLPPHIKAQNIEEGIITFIYRASLDIRQQIWIQCEAFDLLSLLDPKSFFQAATRRLFNLTDGDDLFVRRKAVQLLEDHIGNEKEIKKFLPTISRDISPFVRQAVPPILIAFIIRHKTQNDDIISWLRHIILRDISPQVRAAAMVSVGSSEELVRLFPNTVSDLMFDHFSMEKNAFVLRVGFKIAYDIIEDLINTDSHGEADKFLVRQLPVIINIHQHAQSLSVRRWAALAREKLIFQTDPRARTLMKKLKGVIPHIKPGKKKHLPRAWFADMDEESVGRILSVLAHEDFSLGLTRGITGTWLFRGDRFGFRMWRFLHEFFSSSPDKRQGFSHVTGRKYSSDSRAPSAIGSELTKTKVPGEPLYFETESGWRPYLPLVDEAVSCSKKLLSNKPVKIFTSEGVTHMAPPGGIFRSIIAFICLTLGFVKYTKLRNWHENSQSQPHGYVNALRKLGFVIEFNGFKGTAREKDEDSSVARFFSYGLPLLTPDLWNHFKYYFFSAYENSIYELGLFAFVLLAFFILRHLYLSHAVLKARKNITLVIGGWGTRGKSGVERLKAAVIEALGHGFVNKTTGCEAMFLHAVPFGETREMFLFRPYDKATIWEHHNMICMTWKLKSKIFLWECMALTPPFASVLQQHWTRDDFSTITNTYPDHEDIQGPAGIDIPQVMTNFIPQRGSLITSEEDMKHILRESANHKKTNIQYTGWLEAGLLTPDVLGRFPHEEHPSNVALVLKLSQMLDIDPDFAVREMADRVVPDIGALKIFPIAPIRKRRLEFINGMSANERFATISNWRRTGFESHDYEKQPDTLISTLVNNRADRIPRTRMFAAIIVEDLSVDYHFLIGSNLTGLMGFINTAWDAYLEKISLLPEGKTNTESSLDIFRSMVRRMKIPLTSRTIIQRLNAMLLGIGVTFSEKEVEDALEDSTALMETLMSAQREKEAREIINQVEKWKQEVKSVTLFEEKLAKEKNAKNLDTEFKALLTQWFKQKLIIIENLHVSGNQIVDTICHHTPPGLLNRIMGMQNIKGPGLDYVYRWQAWEKCYLSGQKLLNERQPEIFEQGFNELSAFQDYGILCEDYLEEVLAKAKGIGIAQTERYQAGFSLVKSNLHNAMAEIKETLKSVVPKSNIKTKVVGFLESILDAGDAVKRRKRANLIYKDLINERISHDRAAIELKKLNQRQKGGWFAG